jgi:hypothetical protein
VLGIYMRNRLLRRGSEKSLQNPLNSIFKPRSEVIFHVANETGESTIEEFLSRFETLGLERLLSSEPERRADCLFRRPVHPQLRSSMCPQANSNCT